MLSLKNIYAFSRIDLAFGENGRECVATCWYSVRCWMVCWGALSSRGVGAMRSPWVGGAFVLFCVRCCLANAFKS